MSSIRKKLYILTAITALALGFQNCGQGMQEFSVESSAYTTPENEQIDSGLYCTVNEFGEKKCADEVLVSPNPPKDTKPVSRPRPITKPQPTPKPSPNVVGYNSCSMFPDFNGASNTNTSGSVKTVKGVLKDKSIEEENYVFGIYNVSNKSHGGQKPRKKAVMKVHIPKGDLPVNLLLYAYEPTVWKLTGDVSRVNLLDVQGYHCQTVKNVSRSTDVLVSYRANGGLNKSRMIYTGSNKNMFNSALEFLREKNRWLTKAQYIYEGAGIGNQFVASATSKK